MLNIYIHIIFKGHVWGLMGLNLNPSPTPMLKPGMATPAITLVPALVETDKS